MTQKRQQTSNIRMTMLALACALFLSLFSFHAHADAVDAFGDIIPQKDNITNGRDAENYANDILSDPDRFDKHYVFYHFDGKEFADEEAWLINKLESEHISYDYVLITEQNADSVFQNLSAAAASGASLRGISYQKSGPAYVKKYQTKEMSTLRLMWRQLFGLPKGITFAVKLDRTRKEKATDALLATLQVFSAAFNTAMGLYAKTHGAHAVSIPTTNIVLTMTAMMTWVGYTQYNKLKINEILRQGKTVTLKPDGTLSIDMNAGFYEVIAFLKSNLPKITLRVMSFGVLQLVSGEAWKAVAWAAVISRVSQTGIEKFIIKKQALADKEGRPIIKEGQHSRTKTRVLSQGWDFFMGFIGTFIVLKVHHPVLTWTEYGVMATSIGLSIYHEWEMVKAAGKTLPKLITKIPNAIIGLPSDILLGVRMLYHTLWKENKGESGVRSYERIECETILMETLPVSNGIPREITEEI